MKNFTMENTEGFTENQLEKMNAEYEALMSDVSKEDVNYDNIAQNNSEYILNKYS